ncbi:hypothetical protein EDD18DRAFT_1164925 [Armillaria luteobubalina]|uniref:Uncharacterized protein n=1 Tax=Armillaria luteobubalina TaxID=153913 RepID=A0AA39UNT9_9AGAR|nr:hypothetical protein EDD18DRAFT_1164925 [Armillaria luteobubalina]
MTLTFFHPSLAAWYLRQPITSWQPKDRYLTRLALFHQSNVAVAYYYANTNLGHLVNTYHRHRQLSISDLTTTPTHSLKTHDFVYHLAFPFPRSTTHAWLPLMTEPISYPNIMMCAGRTSSRYVSNLKFPHYLDERTSSKQPDRNSSSPAKSQWRFRFTCNGAPLRHVSRFLRYLVSGSFTLEVEFQRPCRTCFNTDPNLTTTNMNQLMFA